MATLRDIKGRIKTVANIRKITRAMQLVAAAKLTRAQQRAHTVRPYTDELDGVLGALAAAGDADDARDALVRFSFGPDHPPIEIDRARLFEQNEVHRLGVVLFTSDRGLCGSFNTNLIRAAHGFLNDNADKECKLITIGKKGYQFFRRRDVEIVYHKQGLSDRLDLREVKEVTAKLVELYVDGAVDALYLIYAKSIKAALYRVEIQKFLSIPPVEGASSDDNFILEPDRDRLYATLIPLYATTTVFSALADSFASEYGAKMAAMQQATKNADERIADLIIERNRMRQAAITTELAEIVGGANALK